MKKILMAVPTFLILGGMAGAHAVGAQIFFDLYGSYDVPDGQTVRGDNDLAQITVPCEASSYLRNVNYNLDPSQPSPLGHQTGVTIRYKANYGSISEGDQLHFTFHRARLADNIIKCWLMFYEYEGVDTDGDGVGDDSHDANSDGDHYDSLVVAESVGTVAGARTIHFRVTNNGTSYPSNGILYLACAEDNEPPLTSERSGIIPIRYKTMYNPVIVLDELYTENFVYNKCEKDKINNKVCLTVTANACCPNTSMELPDLEVSTPQCFIDMECQFQLNMKPTLSVIDMYPVSLGSTDCERSRSGIFKCYDSSYEPGTKFVDEPSGDILPTKSCTDRTASSGYIVISNNKNNKVDDFLVLGSGGWSGKLEVEMYDVSGRYACSNTQVGSKLPYKALNFRDNKVFIDNNGKESGSGAFGDPADRILFTQGDRCKAVANISTLSTCDETDSLICVPMNSEWKDDVYVGITGNDRLNWVKWGLTESLKIYKDAQLLFTVKMDEKAQCKSWNCCYENEYGSAYFMKWEPNGSQFFIPHLLNNGLTYVKISNHSCWDGDIYAEVWDEGGNFVNNIYLGKVPAHGGKILWGNQILSKARALNPRIGTTGLGTFSILLTVGAPKRDVEIAVGDSRPGKGKMLPVYDAPFARNGGYRNAEFSDDFFEK